MTQAIGWIASVILLLTLSTQVRKQWVDETSGGVSVWLFTGQLLANGLFFTYAALTGDIVFMVANALLFVVSIVGLAIKTYHGRRAQAM